MTGRQVYLRQNVLVEPLFNHWYAWSYLMMPATAAMFTANSHLKVMKSFVASPQVHVNALKNPAMIGGPFIDYDASKVGEIRRLIETTEKEQADLLRLAEAINTLDKIMGTEAQGYSLEPLYQRVPDALKGYVELLYDLNNYPSMRFIEGLLYRSPYYKESNQSLLLSLVNQDGRHFVFSTPRLEDPHHYHLRVPFKSNALDELFKMREDPQPLEHIKERLGVNGDKNDLFASFFTDEPSRGGDRYAGDGVRVRYYGHACLLVESKNTVILTDPLISYEYGAADRRYTYADMPERIDYALVTHNHQDHCMIETLLQLRHKIKKVIVPKSNGGGLGDPSLKMMMKNIGFDDVTEIDEMEALQFEDGTILGLPFLGEHADINIRTKIAYLISLQGKSILFAADSNNIEPKLYKHIHDLVKDVDIVFIGMECAGAPLTWLYGALLTRPLSRKMDQSRRFDGSDSQKGLSLIEELKPRQVYVYAMGQEPWLSYLTSIRYTQESKPIVESNKLIEACRSRGIISERLYCQKEVHL
jgi:L-ascorbate metabolism protein UlaG (beta-lactamase superfamily)